MWTIRVDPDYSGVSIIDLAPLLGLSNEPIEVRWTNTRREIDLVHGCREREVVLVVKDLAEMEDTASSLGLPLSIGERLIDQAIPALTTKSLDWRELSRRIGPQAARSLVTVTLATGLRSDDGDSKMRMVREVLTESILNGVSATDLDVLMTLRKLWPADAA